MNGLWLNKCNYLLKRKDNLNRKLLIMLKAILENIGLVFLYEKNGQIEPGSNAAEGSIDWISDYPSKEPEKIVGKINTGCKFTIEIFGNMNVLRLLYFNNIISRSGATLLIGNDVIKE